MGFGEAIDRYLILSIKANRLSSLVGRGTAFTEELFLSQQITDAVGARTWGGWETSKLLDVHNRLWEAEDVVRGPDRGSAKWCRAATSIPKLNDQRTRLKRMIDDKMGSVRREGKDHGQDEKSQPLHG